MERFVKGRRQRARRKSGKPGVTVGPVIDETAYTAILNYIEIGKSEATLAYQRKDVPPKGFFIPPTIFGNVKPNMRIAREEIFRTGGQRF